MLHRGLQVAGLDAKCLALGLHEAGMRCAIDAKQESRANQALRSNHADLKPSFPRVGDDRGTPTFGESDMGDRLICSEDVGVTQT
jgi:peptide subunit release factor 1 (eRF1)